MYFLCTYYGVKGSRRNRMCGITYKENGLEKEANKAVQNLAHRGPDRQAYELTSRGFVGAARLAIVDVDNGNQPVRTADGYVGAFNGEVYNYREVREELKRRGRRFSTDCDTEVVVNAVAEWGNKAAERFDWQGAYVVESPDGRVYGGRDHFGVSPFYFGRDEQGKLNVASEVPALTKMGVPGGELRRLPQGCVLESQDGKIKLSRYYSSGTKEKQKADPQKLYSLLEKAVAKRVPEEVKHAVILSGIDSSSVAYLAYLQDRKPAMSYTVATDPNSLDVQCARELSGKLGIEHKFLDINTEFVRQHLEGEKKYGNNRVSVVSKVDVVDISFGVDKIRNKYEWIYLDAGDAIVLRMSVPLGKINMVDKAILHGEYLCKQPDPMEKVPVLTNKIVSAPLILYYSNRRWHVEGP